MTLISFNLFLLFQWKQQFESQMSNWLSKFDVVFSGEFNSKAVRQLQCVSSLSKPPLPCRCSLPKYRLSTLYFIQKYFFFFGSGRLPDMLLVLNCCQILESVAALFWLCFCFWLCFQMAVPWSDSRRDTKNIFNLKPN